VSFQKRAFPTASPEVQRERLLHPWPTLSVRRLALVTVAALIVLWGIDGTQASPGELAEGVPNIIDFVQRLFPPEWETETQTLETPAIGLLGKEVPRIGLSSVDFQFPTIITAIVETVQMAIVGTLLAIFLSIPFGLLGARNIAPYPAIYQTTRMVLNANRAIPDIIFALIFVAAVGLGPFGGVLALAVGSIGFMGKVYAESIEAIDPQQVLAVKATGANRIQVISMAVLPQAMPLLASYSLLLFESNVRAATILGIVGAGGVGFELQKYMALFQYQLLTGALIVIIIVVTLLDRVSDRIRKSLIEGGTRRDAEPGRARPSN
jgi:phosphonate transport system permease protein